MHLLKVEDPSVPRSTNGPWQSSAFQVLDALPTKKGRAELVEAPVAALTGIREGDALLLKDACRGHRS